VLWELLTGTAKVCESLVLKRGKSAVDLEFQESVRSIPFLASVLGLKKKKEVLETLTPPAVLTATPPPPVATGALQVAVGSAVQDVFGYDPTAPTKNKAPLIKN
jgi:hypothetical protein